jgi:hypothetical protein
MTSRSTTRTVRFTRPFTLKNVEGEQPAGTYEVEIDEELLTGVSFPVYRRVEARITLPFSVMGASGHQTVPVAMDELDAALARDAAASAG